MNKQFEEHVEDVYAAVSAGRPVRDHGPFGVQIGDQSMQFVPAVVDDPVVTGSQILGAAGARPASDFLVFQVLRDGALEVIRPEETVDLRSAGVDILTFGQYLQPTAHHYPIARWVTPREFETYRERGLRKGFLEVVSGVFVRSSYRAEQVLQKNNVGLS